MSSIENSAAVGLGAGLGAAAGVVLVILLVTRVARRRWRRTRDRALRFASKAGRHSA